ncbi:MAG: O-antigen ligase family protein [Candidatus Liptonbacteria bacterium]|nr:O-antigen ligase family protein [Candidatus Liptonbacteria bacterium]
MLLKISKSFLYCSVLSVLVVLNGTFFPFIGGKNYFYRAIIELAFIFFLLWWAFEAPVGEVLARMKRLLKQPLFLAVSLFFIFFMLATVFAFDSHAAFWSNYERGEGGFQMLHYYGFFFLAVLLFDRKKDWQWMFWASLAAGIGMIFYGIAAAIDFTPMWRNLLRPGQAPPLNFIGPYFPGGAPIKETLIERLFASSRFQGSLGNPAYVAPYLMFSLFYLAWLWVSEHRRTLLKNISYGVLAAFFSVFFLASQTRGAFVGLVAAIFVFLAILVMKNQVWRKWLILLIAVLAMLLGTLIYYRQNDFVKKLPASRLFDITLNNQTFQTRLWTWNSAWQGFKDRPILGWGPENFSAVFDKYFDPRHFVPGQPSETWFDYAHSAIFDYLSETGILGLLSYLAIFGVFYWEWFRKKFNSGNGILLFALMAAIPIGYLVQGLALFNVLPIYINLFLLLAFACYEFRPHADKASQDKI